MWRGALRAVGAGAVAVAAGSGIVTASADSARPWEDVKRGPPPRAEALKALKASELDILVVGEYVNVA